MGAIILLLTTACLADEPANGRAEDIAAYKRWAEVYRGIATSITMRQADIVLPLRPQPLHFYTNPVRMNDQHGAIFLWTEDGRRPAVIGSIWSARSPQNPAVRFVTHEWHSLSVDPNVSATRGEMRLWTSGEPGVSWMKLESSPPPATSRPQRLVQMRSLVRGYSVEIDVQGESDLRLMAQPLFRYPEDTEETVDGAIFAFAMATDPELLVLLEARGAGDQRAWHIAFARLGNKAMKVKDGARIVWSCEGGAPGYSDGKYYLRWRAEEMPAAANR